MATDPRVKRLQILGGFTDQEARDKIGALEQLTTEDKSSLVSAINEVKRSAGIGFTTDETLTLNENGVLSVNTADEPEQDNTLPITSAAVYTTVGNIEILLKTI